MKYIQEFLKLNWDLKILIIKTLLLMWIIRIMVWLLPFRKLQSFMKRYAEFQGQPGKDVDLKKLSWAVNISGNFVFRATCLVKALTAQILFSRENQPSRLLIGVEKGEDEVLEAHAWLEVNNQVVIGESEQEYVVILTMG